MTSELLRALLGPVCDPILVVGCPTLDDLIHVDCDLQCIAFATSEPLVHRIHSVRVTTFHQILMPTMLDDLTVIEIEYHVRFTDGT